MTPQELVDLLQVSGYDTRVRGSEVIVEVCWSCGNDRWNMELNPQKGVWSCWACQSGGRLDKLLKTYLGTNTSIPVQLHSQSGEYPKAPPIPSLQTKPITEVLSAQTYLARRGISVVEAGNYGLSICVQEGHAMYGRILIPRLDFWTGEVRGYVGRSYVPRTRPKYLSSPGPRFLAGYRTRKLRPCLIVEGFFDGITAHRAGFQGAVLGGVWSPEEEILAARLDSRIPLLVCLDGSATEEAHRLLWRLRTIRPDTALIQLPSGVDPGELNPTVLEKFVSAQTLGPRSPT